MNSTVSNDSPVTISSRESVILEWCITYSKSDPLMQSDTAEKAIAELRRIKKEEDSTVSASTKSVLLQLAKAGETQFQNNIREAKEKKNKGFQKEWEQFESERKQLVEKLR